MNTPTVEDVEKLSSLNRKIKDEIAKVIIGQEAVVDELLIALCVGAHSLIVGVPGLAKTLLVQTVADIMGITFKRIQFTPDLMPTDIIGTDVIEEDQETGRRHFTFLKGPIFANIILADEINRTPPKTQAALLEAMQERKVTVGGTDYPLGPPFFVLATQNPIEQEGTYPLPEAQLDRFMFNIYIDYPQAEEERNIIKMTTLPTTNGKLQALKDIDFSWISQIVRGMPVSDHIIDYTSRLVRSTRPKDDYSPDFVKDWVSWGAGPRAGQFLILGAKTRAALRGEFNVSCDDIRTVAPSVLRHRIVPNFTAESEEISSIDIIHRLLETVPEPSERDYQK